MNTTTTPVEIPADVRDNSETVTDYAHMGHRAPDKGVRTPLQREAEVSNASFFGYTVYTWRDVNPDGQRCAFTMIVKEDGGVRHLFHTEYFTRVACIDCQGYRAQSYAEYYVRITDDETGVPSTAPRCGTHKDAFVRAYGNEPGFTVALSEPLRIGQHD